MVVVRKSLIKRWWWWEGEGCDCGHSAQLVPSVAHFTVPPWWD